MMTLVGLIKQAIVTRRSTATSIALVVLVTAIPAFIRLAVEPLVQGRRACGAAPAAGH